MRIEQLHYFQEVAATGSISIAAQRLFVSQQGLSEALKRLENEFGLQLLNRSKVGVTLTEDGEIVARYADKILATYEELQATLATEHSISPALLNGQLKIGASQMPVNTFFPDVADLFRQQYPNIGLTCREMSISDIIAKTNSRDFTLAIISLSTDIAPQVANQLSPDLKLCKLFEDELVACVAKTSPLATQKHLTVKEFFQQDRINFDYVSDPLYASPDDEHVLLTSNNIKVHLKMIRQNMAVSVAPKLFFDNFFSAEEIVALPVKPALKILFSVIMPKNDRSPESKLFLEVLRQYVLTKAKKMPEY